MSDCYRETERTARKAHRCCECMATIDPGERYAVIDIVWEGTAETFKKCLFCAALSQQAWEECGRDEDYAAELGGLRVWLLDSFAESDALLVAELFPLVTDRGLEQRAKLLARFALLYGRGSQARGLRVGQRLAAQFRLRALRASRWTVTA